MTIVQFISIGQGIGAAVVALCAACVLHRLGGDFILFWPVRDATAADGGWLWRVADGWWRMAVGWSRVAGG